VSPKEVISGLGFKKEDQIRIGEQIVEKFLNGQKNFLKASFNLGH